MELPLPQPPAYHLMVPSPLLPPVAVNVVELPLQIEVVPEIPVGADAQFIYETAASHPVDWTLLSE